MVKPSWTKGRERLSPKPSSRFLRGGQVLTRSGGELTHNATEVAWRPSSQDCCFSAQACLQTLGNSSGHFWVGRYVIMNAVFHSLPSPSLFFFLPKGRFYMSFRVIRIFLRQNDCASENWLFCIQIS